MNVTQIASLLGAGFLAGVVNSIAGGGTLITFPTLLFVGLQSITANATSTVALLPGTLSSFIGYRNNIPSVHRWIFLFSPVSLIGGLIGGVLLTLTPESLFDWLVPFLILFATLLFMAQNAVNRLVGRSEITHGKEPSRTWLIGAVVFQFCVGIYGGYFGAGIGILMLASLGLLGFGNVHQMNTVKVVLGFLINIIAAVYFVISGLIHWPSALVMALASMAGGYSGAHFAQRVPQTWVRHMITAVGLIISTVMFYQQFK